MLKKTPHIINNFLIGFLITILLWMPDFLLKLFTTACKAKFSILFFCKIFIVIFLLTFLKNRFIFYGLCLIFFLMEIVQLVHVTYMGYPISSFILSRLKEDMGEIFETGTAYLDQVYFVFIILGACYFLSVYLYIKSYSKTLKIPFFSIILSLLVGVGVSKLSFLKKSPLSYCAVSTSHSLNNSIKTFGQYFFGNCDQVVPETNYKPYTVVKKNEGLAKNIVLIMGESMRHDHMSLFDYYRPTTPFLKSLSSEVSFIFKPAISGATCTVVALPVFMNLIREPGHTALLRDKTTNLLRLAKENGYKTILISAQGSNLLSQVGIEFLDEIVTKDSFYMAKFNDLGDEAILEIFKKIPLGEKNFIVLHLRNLHSPYEKNYAHCSKKYNIYPIEGDRNAQMNNAYDNAMHFYDHVMSQIINYFKKTFSPKDKNFIIYTADHGELLGEGGLYGHTKLHPNVFQVPFWLYSFNYQDQKLKSFFDKVSTTHYEIGIFIADLLGYDIINPNIEDEVFFVNNDDYNFIKYKREKDKINYDAASTLDKSQKKLK